MTRLILNSMIALWLAAFSAPGFAWACDRPCAMSQKQMAACAKACALAKDASRETSLGKAACVHLKLNQAQPMAAWSQQDGPGFTAAFAFITPDPARGSAPFLTSARPWRGPPESARSQAPLELPASHAPPSLI